MKERPEARTTGRREAKQTDHLEIRTSQSSRRRTEVEGLLRDALDRLHATDERDVAAYANALGALRKRPDEVQRAVAELERSSPNDHVLRWTLYYVLAELELPELAPVLVEGAVRDLPQITEATACETVEEEEILVAVMAVEGLERLAQKDPDSGVRALLEVVERQPHVAVRAAAAQAILELRPDARSDITRLLPEEQRFVLEARRVPVAHLTAVPERGGAGRTAHRAPKLPADATAPQIQTPQIQRGKE